MISRFRPLISSAKSSENKALECFYNHVLIFVWLSLTLPAAPVFTFMTIH
jgi:hypothetical protein